MTKKRNPHDQGEKVSKAAEERTSVAAQLATINANNERPLVRRDELGRVLPLPDIIVDDALFRLSCGEPMRTIALALGFDRSALLSKAHTDPDFASRLRLSQEMGAYAAAENTFAIADGVEGFSTGNLDRDKAKIDVAWRWTKTIGSRIFGDRLAIDHRQIVMKFTSDDEGMI